MTEVAVGKTVVITLTYKDLVDVSYTVKRNMEV